MKKRKTRLLKTKKVYQKRCTVARQLLSTASARALGKNPIENLFVEEYRPIAKAKIETKAVKICGARRWQLEQAKIGEKPMNKKGTRPYNRAEFKLHKEELQ